MAGFIISTVAYFVAAFLIRSWLDEMDIPKTMTRGIIIFVGAALVSYGVALGFDFVIS